MSSSPKGFRFSLVYPTRHRPQFVEMALAFLERQGYDNFEVIVSDNFLDDSLSCEAACRKPRAFPVRYVRPPAPLSMVANWNYALPFATGDYVCYFTDKMFLLPGTLAAADRALREIPADIVNWVDDKFSANTFPDYFGPGVYITETPGVPPELPFVSFDPRAELHRKAFAAVPRTAQDASHYARGKLCFGAYSRRLVDRILERAGEVFHDITPDYSSMILGLSCAESAIEIGRAGIVHVGTDLSNGGQSEIRDELALRFLSELRTYPQLLNDMLIPGLYSAQHNVVAHDYLSLKRRFSLPFDLHEGNWLAHIRSDLELPARRWSSTEVEREQLALYREFAARAAHVPALLERAPADTVSPVPVAELPVLKRVLLPLIPKFLLRWRRALFPRPVYANPSIRQVDSLLGITDPKVR